MLPAVQARALVDQMTLHIQRPHRRDMSIESQASRVYRSVLKKTPRTAGEVAAKAGFSSGRAIAGALSLLVGEGSIVRLGRHSGSTRPTYLKAY